MNWHNSSWVYFIKQPRVFLIDGPKLHTFTHEALHQSPQAQHDGVQGFSLFIQSCLQMEFLLVLRIVTPVSVARIGGGICRQIVQFRTVCGGLTFLTCRGSGRLISVFRAWAVFSHALETPGALSCASGQCTFGHGWCSRVSQYHCRAQNSGDVNDVVAFLVYDSRPHHMHVREWQCCTCPPVISWMPTHFLNEHLFVFFVPPHALHRQSDLCVCGCRAQQGGSVFCDIIVMLKDVRCAIYEFAYHTHEFLT